MATNHRMMEAAVADAIARVGAEAWAKMSKGQRWEAALPYLQDRLHKAAEKRAKRPTYDRALDILARTDDANEAVEDAKPIEAFAGYATVHLVAELFGKDHALVAAQALTRRKALGIK